MTEPTSIIPELPDASGENRIDSMLEDLMKKLETSEAQDSRNDSSGWTNNIFVNGIIISFILLFISFFVLQKNRGGFKNNLSVF